ncbi:MAG: 50S ribosomal protein L19 [Alphaproteobacteria bacterium]|jgi:large subunit ribosomal protein L19
MNKLQTFEKQQVEKLAQLKTIPQYRAGDTLKVGIKVIEVKADDAKDKKKKTDKKAEAQAKERIQYFEGVLIAKKNRGVNSSVVLRKISNGEGVERLFKIYSPSVVSIEVIKRGVVKRAKLYYLRDLKGKKARIKEKLVGLFGSEVVAKPEVKQEANQPSE